MKYEKGFLCQYCNKFNYYSGLCYFKNSNKVSFCKDFSPMTDRIIMLSKKYNLSVEDICSLIMLKKQCV